MKCNPRRRLKMVWSAEESVNVSLNLFYAPTKPLISSYLSSALNEAVNIKVNRFALIVKQTEFDFNPLFV